MVSSDDATQRQLSDLAHGLGSMSPPDLHDATRRALLTIYSPQQVAIWLDAHAAGDPTAVARKALVLCGVDVDRTAPVAATRPERRIDPEPPGAAAHARHPSALDRRAYERLTGRITRGEVLILIRLDGLDEVDDPDGPAVRDQVMRDQVMHDQVRRAEILRMFALVLRDHMRIREFAVRLGDGEFLLVIEGPETSAATPLLERLTIAWDRRRPAPVRLASGVAAVSGHLDEALEAADRRLYGRADDDAAASVRPGAGLWA